MLINQTEVTPRDVPSLPRFDKPSLVTARWLSPRTRELLRERGFGFLDSTGNAEIALPEPGLYIRTDGAARDPQPKPSASPGMRGPRVWALLRTLIEVAPPYGVTELSRALDLDTDVHWEGMLRQLVSTYSVFDADDTSTWVTSSGPDAFLRDLPGR